MTDQEIDELIAHDADRNPYLAVPPYSAWSAPKGGANWHAVLNAHGINCLRFKSTPGAVFTNSRSAAELIAAKWNDGARAGMN